MKKVPKALHASCMKPLLTAPPSGPSSLLLVAIAFNIYFYSSLVILHAVNRLHVFLFGDCPLFTSVTFYLVRCCIMEKGI